MLEALLALIVATTALLGSPGPAPLSLAAVGATVGFRKGLRYLCGLLAGLIVVVVGAAAGIAVLFARFPNLELVIKIAGGAYLLWIAYRIATASPLAESAQPLAAPPALVDGFVLNLLNPKAYAALLALLSQFRLPFDDPIAAFTLTGLVCFLVAVGVDLLWLWAGALIRRRFAEPRSARRIRITFAVLIVLATGAAFVGWR